MHNINRGPYRKDIWKTKTVSKYKEKRQETTGKHDSGEDHTIIRRVIPFIHQLPDVVLRRPHSSNRGRRAAWRREALHISNVFKWNHDPEIIGVVESSSLHAVTIAMSGGR